MKLLQITNSLTGSLIFEYESENNTIKETLLEAIKAKADLRGAKLRCAYLSDADLRYANLTGANLTGAKLRCADLRDADLTGAKLRCADLRDANLRYANLSGADLRDANLRCADLTGADLRYANLSGADLRDANLRDAYLTGANLTGAKLSCANLRDADLTGANLTGADLRCADLSCANLSCADIRCSDITGADLTGAEEIPALIIAQTRVCAEGDIFGYKKCLNGVIVKLLIPKEAKRNNSFGRKCRAEYAEVVEIIGADEAISKHDNSFTYKVGDTVIPTAPFDEDFTNECSTGIHFFITLEEAKNY